MCVAVSVILPIYNVEKYLYRCLLSVCHQTLSDIEIICVDDGSTDGSGKILNYFKEKDSRVRVIRTENHGYGHAMNTGLAHAEGDYIAIVEPDDYIRPDMLENLYDTARIYGADIVKSDFFRFREENGEMIRMFQPAADEASWYGRLVHPRDERECFRFIMNIWCGIYRRSMIEKNHIRFHESPGAAFQDNGFWFQTMCLCERLFYVNRSFYMNRRDNPSSSVNNPNNLYCGNDEYHFIHGLMKENSRLADFIDGYALKKYQTYKFNLNRAGENQKADYEAVVRQEWQQDLASGELRQEYFRPEEWQDIMAILNGGNKKEDAASELTENVQPNKKKINISQIIKNIRGK